MRIATFNINGIDTRLPNLLAWLKETTPDVVCLQELKATTDRFPQEALRALGYDCAWIGEARWNGVAIASRHGPPIVTRTRLPGDPADVRAATSRRRSRASWWRRSICPTAIPGRVRNSPTSWPGSRAF